MPELTAKGAMAERRPWYTVLYGATRFDIGDFFFQLLNLRTEASGVSSCRFDLLVDSRHRLGIALNRPLRRHHERPQRRYVSAVDTQADNSFLQLCPTEGDLAAGLIDPPFLGSMAHPSKRATPSQ